eukprot:755379-Hanusia_phi.AAC.4
MGGLDVDVDVDADVQRLQEGAGVFTPNALIADSRPNGETAREVVQTVANTTDGANDANVNKDKGSSPGQEVKFEKMNDSSEFLCATNELSKFDDVGAKNEQARCWGKAGNESSAQMVLDASTSLEDKEQDREEDKEECDVGGEGTSGDAQTEFEKGWEGHHYAARVEAPRNAGKFMNRVQKEWTLLR